MLSKLGILVTLAFVGNAAMASYAIDCGAKTKPEDGKVEGSVFSMSSEDDNFKGAPSKKVDGWIMKYQGVEYPPAKNASIFVVKAKNSPHIKAIVITVAGKNKVNHKLLIEEPYADEPSLTITVAGKKGSASFNCLSFVD